MFQSKRLEDLIGLDISYEDETETKYSSKTDLGFWGNKSYKQQKVNLNKKWF